MEKMTVENDDIIDTNDSSITEESLMSLEKLDRASPDLWPEESIAKFIAQNLSQIDVPTWSNKLTSVDTSQVYRLGNLSVTELVLEVKRLHDSAYRLGVEESKEMTRAKYLNIFQKK